MADWENRFRRARFRGVRFWVDSDDGPERGRRAVIHEISGGEAPVTEDMGRLSRSFLVSAYVSGDDAISEGVALERAAEVPGAGRLVLPMDPAQRVHCIGCVRNRSKDRNGFIAYRMIFREAGAGSAGLASPSAQLRISISGVAGVSAELSVAF